MTQRSAVIRTSTFEKAQRTATSWPASQKGGSKRVWAAAALIHWLHAPRLPANELKLSGGRNAEWGTLDVHEAVAALARSYDWLNSTPQDALEVATKGISILRTCRYDINSMTPEQLISACQLSFHSDAANVTKTLSELSANGELDTALARGLVGALNTWFSGEVNGWIEAGELRNYRQEKSLRDKKEITKSQVARKIGKTYRQYHRYEIGESLVPQDVGIELLEYLLPITPLLPPKAPKRSKIKGTDGPWLKGRELD